MLILQLRSFNKMYVLYVHVQVQDMQRISFDNTLLEENRTVNPFLVFSGPTESTQ